MSRFRRGSMTQWRTCRTRRLVDQATAGRGEGHLAGSLIARVSVLGDKARSTEPIDAMGDAAGRVVDQVGEFAHPARFAANGQVRQ
jgi:hypothetical protein